MSVEIEPGQMSVDVVMGLEQSSVVVAERRHVEAGTVVVAERRHAEAGTAEFAESGSENACKLNVRSLKKGLQIKCWFLKTLAN